MKLLAISVVVMLLGCSNQKDAVLKALQDEVDTLARENKELKEANARLADPERWLSAPTVRGRMAKLRQLKKDQELALKDSPTERGKPQDSPLARLREENKELIEEILKLYERDFFRLRDSLANDMINASKAETDKTKKEPPTKPTDQNATKAKPVKELTPEEQKQKALMDSVVGGYELKRENGDTIKRVFLENGIRERYTNGKKELLPISLQAGKSQNRWSIVNGEIHVRSSRRFIDVYKLNADKSISWITYIRVGSKREDSPKKAERIYKRIK